jgi:hypothetical protein
LLVRCIDRSYRAGIAQWCSAELRAGWSGLGIFLFTIASRSALGPTQPPIQWIPKALSLGIKRPEREADRSPPSSAEVKEWVELYIHSPNTPSWRPYLHRITTEYFSLYFVKYSPDLNVIELEVL